MISVTAPNPKLNDRRWNAAGVRSFVVFAAVFVVLTVVSMVVQYHNIAEARRDSIGDGVNPATYGFDLSNFDRDLSLLVGSGHPKGGLPVIDDPAVIDIGTIDEMNNPRLGSWSRFIVSKDMVVGVSINGESRAYPTRILNWHEIVNDTLGGVPITVVYNSITRTAMVFERTLDGEAVRFGYSGMLYNSHPVLYDIRENAEDESLWPVLCLAAEAGPAKGEALKLLPCQLIEWGTWREAHPQTSSIIGLKTFRKRYRRAPYTDDFESGQPQYPLASMVGEDHPTGLNPWDTVVAVRQADGAWEVLGRAFGDDRVTAPGDRPTVYTRWFAWYAVHGDAGAASVSLD